MHTIKKAEHEYMNIHIPPHPKAGMFMKVINTNSDFKCMLMMEKLLHSNSNWCTTQADTAPICFEFASIANVAG
jgi:hypothetical protein